MKLLVSSFLALTLVLFGFDFPTNPQPETLFMKDLIVQPVLESSDLPNFNYTRNVKIYYKDLMPNPITLSNGDLMKSYCSESSLVEILLPGDTVRVQTVPRLSCEILAIARFSTEQVRLLKRKPAMGIRITNLTTENVIFHKLSDVHFFNRSLVE
jgi:hypothetical protein